MKNVKKIILGLLCACFCCPFVRADVLSEDKRAAENKDFYAQLALLATAMEVLRAGYVDEKKIDYNKLAEGALKGMLREMDPYSAYETPIEFRENTARLAGERVGIGVVVVKRPGESLRLVGIQPNSPAAKAGLKAGEMIVSIDDRKTFPLALDECIGLISGAAGKSVRLMVRSDNTASADEREVQVTRAVIKQPAIPVQSARMLEDGIGYIRLNSFSVKTADELDQGLAKLRKEKLRALVLDLRYNPGGLLQTAFSVCNRFLDRDKLIVSVEGRSENDKKEFKTGGKSIRDTEIPLIVLVNGYSASSSEIVAGCLKDHKRAKLVGERTFGKGSVQRLQQLPNGGAMRYTIAHYYTPSRTLIHGKGIEPDVCVDIPRKEDYILGMQLNTQPGIILPPGRHALKDVQLEKAVQLLKEELN